MLVLPHSRVPVLPRLPIPHGRIWSLMMQVETGFDGCKASSWSTITALTTRNFPMVSHVNVCIPSFRTQIPSYPNLQTLPYPNPLILPPVLSKWSCSEYLQFYITPCWSPLILKTEYIILFFVQITCTSTIVNYINSPNFFFSGWFLHSFIVNCRELVNNCKELIYYWCTNILIV